MQNARLDEVQAGIKIAGRNINNLRYADDTTLMAESEEELRSLLMKVKEESSQPRDQTHISYVSWLTGGFFTMSATWEAQAYLELVHFAWFLSWSQFPGGKNISEHHYRCQSTLHLLFGL